MTRRKRCKGFTLIEIIVVLSLLAVSTTLGMIMFSRVSDTWRQTTIRTEMNATADVIFDQMRRDFTEVVPPKLSGAAVRATQQSARDNRFFRVALEDDQVTIPVEIVAGPDGRLQRLDVKYHVDRKDGAATLMRTSSLPGAPDGTTVKVADGVLAMCVEFAGKGPAAAWKREWTGPSAPSAVRVSVTLMDSDRPYEQIARKAVFPIEVN
jgi:type II secretion system protein J